MSPTEGEQHKIRRQKSNPRRHKSTVKPVSSNKREGAILPIPPKSTITPTKPTVILRRSSADITQLTQSTMDSVGTPITPPRPRISRGIPQGEDLSATEPKGQRRRKLEKIQGQQQTDSASPIPGLSTPKPTARPQSLTPGRTNGTPLQAYAGPTFHASPAASSLPMPKFFSKSVPAAEKGASLSSIMGKEVLDSSPESPYNENEESPTLEKAQRLGENQVREESPLDIFFKADRREKEKQQPKIPPGTPNGLINNMQLPSTLNTSSGFRLSMDKDMRHHSRHATGSSVGELFPLDMDDGTQNKKSHVQKTSENSPGFFNSSLRPSSAPPNSNKQGDSEEEERKAKTLLLKKLLMSPQLQHPAATSSWSEVSREQNITSIREQLPYGRPPAGRSLSGSPTPTPSHDSTSSYRSLKQTESLPLLQNLMKAKEKSTNSPLPRYDSSSLRKEVTLPISPMRKNIPEFPATPTGVQGSKQHLSSGSHISQNTGTIRSSSFLPDFSSSNKIFHGMDDTPIQSSNSTSSMEDDLRRILKLNVLGGNGANGVRS